MLLTFLKYQCSIKLDILFLKFKIWFHILFLTVVTCNLVLVSESYNNSQCLFNVADAAEYAVGK